MENNSLRPVTLKVQIPFCVHRCEFCSRPLIGGRDTERLHFYALALQKEILQNAGEFEDCRITAIILTGYSDFSYAREAIRFRVTDYQLKPLDMEELRSAVEKAKADCQVKDAYISSLKEKKELKEVSAMGDLRKNPVEKVLVKEMVAYIEENYGKKVLMQDVVDKFHYSETFLNKRFKESTGITFNEYLNRYRMQKSLEMLQKGEENLNTIAWKCGFGDYKYFGSVFRKYVGRSPKEYVKAIR